MRAVTAFNLFFCIFANQLIQNNEHEENLDFTFVCHISYD